MGRNGARIIRIFNKVHSTVEGGLEITRSPILVLWFSKNMTELKKTTYAIE